MQKENKAKGILRLLRIFLLIFFFVFFPVNLKKENIGKIKAQSIDQYVWIEQDTTWTKNDNLVFDKSVIVTDGATLTIEKGSRIEFTGGFDAVLMVDDGRIVANGTSDERITFSAPNPNSGSFIQFMSPSGVEASFFRYVEISNFGYFNDDVIFAKRDFFVKTAFAQEISGVSALYFFSGKLHIENTIFKNNTYSDVEVGFDVREENKDDFLRVVNSNFENNSNNTAMISEIYCYAPNGCDQKVLMKDNWYGNPNGPSGEAPDENTQGEIVQGNVFLDDWRENDLIVDPVVIIPGIMGSAKVFGEWQLDPITHAYDDLMKSFQKNGYASGKNIFEFPYEWRDSNEITAGKLENKVKEVIFQTKVSKVDLVAHSMGGLVARSYMEGNDYDNVDQLVTLGTPHRGSPESYLSWEAGEFGVKFEDFLVKHHFKNEAKHAGYNDIFSYIQDKVVSVRELLPDYDYLFEVSDESMRRYPDGYPKNDFLENLNKTENLEKLKNVSFINIGGDVGSDQSTISEIRIVDSFVPGKWEHGMPENFYDKSSHQGLKYGRGDETVPVFSVNSVSANKTISIDSAHGDLPTKAQCKIISELTAIPENQCEYVNDWNVPNILLFNVFSPIDIQVIAPDGKKAGKNFETGEIFNEISGAYYTGYDTDAEFITIPNPTDGEYRVVIQGTGEGEYKIEAVKLSENPNNPQESTESIGVIAGLAEEGEEHGNTVKVKGEDVMIIDEAGAEDAEAPEIEIKSPENGKIYFNSEMLTADYSVFDNISSWEKTQVEVFLDKERISESNNIDLSLGNLGEHELEVIAKDEAGNIGKKDVSFRTIATIGSIKSNVAHYAAIGLMTKKTEKKLSNKIRGIEKMMRVVEKMEEKPIKNEKRKAVEFLKRNINREIDFLAREIGKEEKRLQINSKIRNLLIESLYFIKYQP